MKEKQDKVDRRNFLKAVGAAGLVPSVVGVTNRLASTAAVAGSNKSNAAGKKQKPKSPQVPRRELGKTGVRIPCLSIGTAMSNLVENQVILRNTLRWGVSSWDTATNYTGGNSELGIGKFLSKNPDVRKELFIISKPPDIRTTVPDVVDIDKHLQTSLKRMNTKYIDLYFGVHSMLNPAQLTDELKRWAESAKKQKLIRFFGFSTHKNMAQNLTAAAKLDWIDAIMTAYNFRLMQDPKLQAAVEACNKVGIGLIAMKTQAASFWMGHAVKVKTETDKKLVGHFQKRGFSEGQSKIKVVLQDKRLSSACVSMGNTTLLASGVAAVLDKTKLSQTDMDVFKEYTWATCNNYCAGCAYICDSVLPNAPYVSDIMRYLMYYNSYGDEVRARELFAEIPGKVRNRLLSTDYRIAEACCPQHIPIGKMVAEAVSKLA